MAEKDKQMDMEKAAEILTNHVAAMEAKQAELIERVMATAAGPPTLRERRAGARAKLAGYHADARAGKVERYRSPTRTDREQAEQQAARAEADDAA